MMYPQSTIQPFTTSNLRVPAEGPRVIPLLFDFSVYGLWEVDLQNVVATAKIQSIQGFWVDNSGNTAALTITINGSRQVINVGPGMQGFYPALVPMPPRFTVSTPVGGGMVTVQALNFHTDPVVWGGAAGPGATVPNPIQVTNPSGQSLNVAVPGGVMVDGPVEIINTPGQPFSAAITGSPTMMPITPFGNSDQPAIFPAQAQVGYQLVLGSSGRTLPMMIATAHNSFVLSAGVTYPVTVIGAQPPPKNWYATGFLVQATSDAASVGNVDMIISFKDSMDANALVSFVLKPTGSPDSNRLANAVWECVCFGKGATSALTVTCAPALSAGQIYITVKLGLCNFTLSGVGGFAE